MRNPRRILGLGRFRTVLASASLRLRILLAVLAAVSLGGLAARGLRERTPTVLGPTEVIENLDGQLAFKARVDTGATTCSLHADEWSIQDEAEAMVDNVGKVIRFCVNNGQGGVSWLERRIEELSTVTTSEGEEQRYKVYMTFRCRGVEKRVLVSLNDRSHMEYPMLIGRNFLAGDFLVDVGW